MPKSKADILKALADEKNGFILEQLATFEQLIEAAALILYDQLVTDFLEKLRKEDGNLSTDAANIARVGLIEKIWTGFEQAEGFQLIAAFVTDINEIVKKGSAYYSELIPSQVESKAIEAIINQKLGLEWKGSEWIPKKDGYVNALMQDATIRTDIKNLAYNNIIAGNGFTALKTSFKNYLVSQDKQPSEFKQFYQQTAFDTYSTVDRLNSTLHADRLGLKYFLYNGGRVEHSRYFCIQNHGKCFSTDEADTWVDLIGRTQTIAGKKTYIGPIVQDAATYNPLTDLGGINCRHSCDFISEEIALHLRKGKA